MPIFVASPMKYSARRMFRDIRTTVFSLLAIIVGSLSATQAAMAQEDTQKIIGIMSGGVTGTYARFAFEMSSTLDGDTLRVIPMLGKGSRQNIKDLLFLNGVDIAIVQNDVLDYYKKTQSIPNIEESIRYIGKLYNEEIHVVAKSDVEGIKSLEGELVSVGAAGSGIEMTAEILFSALGTNIDKVNLSDQEALEELKAGNIKAAVIIVGKPGATLKAIDAASGLKLLPVSIPKTVQASYFDATLSHDDYPNLIPQGDSVVTVAVGAVLAVFNWREGSSRYQAVTAFCNDLNASLEILKSNAAYHPKWKEVDFSIEVPGWQRFSGMDAILNKSQNQ